MGFTPSQVGAMSLWEFAASFHGWKTANCASSEKAAYPTAEQHAANVAAALARA